MFYDNAINRLLGKKNLSNRRPHYTSGAKKTEEALGGRNVAKPINGPFFAYIELLLGLKKYDTSISQTRKRNDLSRQKASLGQQWNL